MRDRQKPARHAGRVLDQFLPEGEVAIVRDAALQAIDRDLRTADRLGDLRLGNVEFQKSMYRFRWRHSRDFPVSCVG